MAKDNGDLRIAMIGHKRIPSREGGVEIVVEELATRMVESGNSVTCYNRSGHHISGSEFDNDNVSEYRGVRIKRAFTVDKKGLAAMTSSFFASISAAFGKYDVVHYHAEGPCAMMWIPRLFGKRCIATIHGLDWARAKWGGFASKYIKFGEKTAVKCANEIIVLSESVQKYFKDTYSRDTIFIPNGVSRPQILNANEIKDKFGIEKDEYYLYLGRLVPEKGIEYLINAFKNVKTNKKLVIAGGSSDTDEFAAHLKQIAENDERIVFTGFVQGTLLKELYSNAYVYVLPSDLEGMPLSLLEAMSYSNCCLTSNIPECANVVAEHGITFEKSDENDLTAKLNMLENDASLVNEMKSNAADFVCKAYDWDDVTKRTLELYK